MLKSHLPIPEFFGHHCIKKKHDNSTLLVPTVAGTIIHTVHVLPCITKVRNECRVLGKSSRIFYLLMDSKMKILWLWKTTIQTLVQHKNFHQYFLKTTLHAFLKIQRWRETKFKDSEIQNSVFKTEAKMSLHIRRILGSVQIPLNMPLSTQRY